MKLNFLRKSNRNGNIVEKKVKKIIIGQEAQYPQSSSDPKWTEKISRAFQ